MPCRMAFGTAPPARLAVPMFHPCALKTYKPCSVLTLQLSGRLSARATPEVPSAIAATRLTNAHAASRDLVIRLTNFIFIAIIPLVLAFFDFSLLSCHFRPFTEVQNGNHCEVTQEMTAPREIAPLSLRSGQCLRS